MSTPSGAVTSSGASGQTSSAVGGGAYNPVRVNLEAVIDVTGEVQVFSVPSTTLDNVVVCSVNMPAAALYSGGNGVFELTEPSQGRGDISGYVSKTGSVLNGIAQLPIATLGSELQTVLTGELNAATANPFAQNQFNKELPDGGIDLKKGGRLKLRHRFVFHAGDEKAAKIQEAFEVYAKEAR